LRTDWANLTVLAVFTIAHRSKSSSDGLLQAHQAKLALRVDPLDVSDQALDLQDGFTLNASSNNSELVGQNLKW
jgi:hypothetical protein